MVVFMGPESWVKNVEEEVDTEGLITFGVISTKPTPAE